jgi:4-amino-4-deoxy-L-arabinose transferase-like glycosyltransferase
MNSFWHEAELVLFSLWGIAASFYGVHFIRKGKNVEALLCAIFMVLTLILIKLIEFQPRP